MPNEFDELLRGALRTLGKVGLKAAARAFDSALQDVDGAATEARRRIARARKRLDKMTNPARADVDDDNE